MNYDHLIKQDPEVAAAVFNETKRQANKLELIASENFVSPAVLEAQGSVLTNKYAEGYPGKRYYGGCEYVDEAESLAIKRAKILFGAEHVNVQPHSGTQANMAVFFTLMNPGDSFMGMSLACGGHLSHGHPLNFSGRFFKVIPYGVKKDTETIDYDEVRTLAKENKPKMILAGASAYSRFIDFAKFKEIADEVGAYFVVDMAHIAGLVATKLHPDPVPHADFTTTTTHKTLRGPRAGLILCKEKYKKDLNKNLFPGFQGGPLMHIIAAKAVALGEALKPEFKTYQEQIVKNAKALALELANLGLRIVSGGTDNHLMLVDLTPLNITGKIAETALDKAGITVNKNAIPFDTQPPLITSGIRIGTPALTTRDMKEEQMKSIASLIYKVLKSPENESTILEVQKGVLKLSKEFPIYQEIIQNFNEKLGG